MSEALDIALREFEARFAQAVPGPACAYAFPGGEYIEFNCGARTRGDAEPLPPLPESEELAIRGLFNALNVYAESALAAGRNILIWRMMPETAPCEGHAKGDIDQISLAEFPDDQPPYWAAYARLLIADRLPDMGMASQAPQGIRMRPIFPKATS